jgi:hypothetical protein
MRILFCLASVFILNIVTSQPIKRSGNTKPDIAQKFKYITSLITWKQRERKTMFKNYLRWQGHDINIVRSVKFLCSVHLHSLSIAFSVLECSLGRKHTHTHIHTLEVPTDVPDHLQAQSFPTLVHHIFFVVLGLELRAYTLSLSTSPFLGRVFLKIGSKELFVCAGFEPWSSWSLPPE